MIVTENDRYVSMRDAMDFLGVSRQTIYRWAWAGHLPSVKISGRRLVPVDALRREQLERGADDE